MRYYVPFITAMIASQALASRPVSAQVVRPAAVQRSDNGSNARIAMALPMLDSVSSHRSHHALVGALIGGGIGVVAGVVSGTFIPVGCPASGSTCSAGRARANAMAAAGLLGGVSFAAVGGLIGVALPVHHEAEP
jgi:hypothetical protein